MLYCQTLSGKTLQRYEKKVRKANIGGRKVRKNEFLKGNGGMKQSFEAKSRNKKIFFCVNL